MNQMKSENVLRAILVVQDQMTTVAKTSLSENATQFNMEIFLVSIVAFMMLLNKISGPKVMLIKQN